MGGKIKLDNEWTKLLDEVSKLEQHLQTLRVQDKEDQSVMSSAREMALMETEVDNLRLRLKDIEKSLCDSREK